MRSWFADDAKLYRNITCDENYDQLALNSENVISWSDNVGMSFNLDKCKFYWFAQIERLVNYI